MLTPTEGRRTAHGDDVRSTAAGSVEMVIPCVLGGLQPTLDWFVERLGFRVEVISPADDPSAAVLSGHGASIRLDRDAPGSPGTLRFRCADPDEVANRAGADGRTLVAPNGTRIELVEAEPRVVLPALRPSVTVSHLAENAHFGLGRAGMGYRDLVPDRQGGWMIASHIRIPDAGPVADWVHHHRIHFQMIYCARGWVRVVYEDQGEPFVLHAGDCVVQPPGIRHRVLESSAGLEVVELGCPAVHDTLADHDMELPTATIRPEREFGGQRFVRHVAADAVWEPWSDEGFECRDSGIGAATHGIGEVRVARSTGATSTAPRSTDDALRFVFVLEGSLDLEADGEIHVLAAGDSAVLPPATVWSSSGWAPGTELLDVSVPIV